MHLDRRAQTHSFLAAAGWPGAHVELLAADASFRHYHRVHQNGTTAVLMDAPPDKEDCIPFVAVDHYLRSQELLAPNIYHAEIKNGLLLLEDFGNERLSTALRRDQRQENMLYQMAVDILCRLQSHAPPAHLAYSATDCNGAMPLGFYDDATLSREVALFHIWYLPAVAIDLPATAVEQFHSLWRGLWQDIVAQTRSAPVLTLRDYHADNLMLLNSAPSQTALGLIDFQDALAGHPAYDLASLLQDIRYEVSPLLEHAMLDHYLLLRPAYTKHLGDAAFLAAYNILGAQRLTKIIGIFTRLSRRDNKHHYLDLLPRLWQLLERQLQAPVLAPIAEWFAAYVPPSCRHVILP